jgi:capsular exopolysaccharide synthesis family protein
MSKIHKALLKAEQEAHGFAPTPADVRAGHAAPPVEAVLPRTLDESALHRVAFRPEARKYVEVPHAVSEDFYSLHNRLELQPAAVRPRSFLVTSALEGEGSSVVSLALAGSLVRKAGRSVVLVDGDFRNPNLERFFAVNGAPGLREVLCGKAPVEQAIQITDQERLYFLPAGQRDGDAGPADTVRDPARLRNFSAFLKQHFNYVLVDSSPVLGNTDVQVLAAAVDGVILVVKAHRTRRQIVQEAKKLLDRSGAKVVGVVLNRRKFPIPGWLYRSL